MYMHVPICMFVFHRTRSHPSTGCPLPWASVPSASALLSRWHSRSLSPAARRPARAHDPTPAFRFLETLHVKTAPS